ncbi:hypothetical protein [Pseudorhodobacter sp.]|uniref:hypothetical protein n=1 Tax=Pseudorhodobacter sp. TaxID=1934400 RepID=UPI002648870B|nr:hypothetical protein [Pseudorhodobacter sp.]MDN5785727.1 hypothetical protein [Pseudorhodobacter sp.]
MAERATEILDRAGDALCGIDDLLCSISNGNLHLVDPNNLSALLQLVHDQIRRAENELTECQKTG